MSEEMTESASFFLSSFLILISLKKMTCVSTHERTSARDGLVPRARILRVVIARVRA